MSKPAKTDEHWMREALKEAQKAARKKEVPIGAIAIRNGKTVGRAHNVRERTQNPLGHAEILLIEKLSKKFRTWRLDDITIYVTCEPCLMCAGAMLQARIARIVYGCADPKAGAMGTLYDVSHDPRLNHSIEVNAGVLETKCSGILTKFFDKLREKRKSAHQKTRAGKKRH